MSQGKYLDRELYKYGRGEAALSGKSISGRYYGDYGIR